MVPLLGGSSNTEMISLVYKVDLIIYLVHFV